MKTPFIPSLALLFLFSCSEDIPNDPFEYVGRYTVCAQIDCAEGLQVNNRSNQPGSPKGLILKFEAGKSTDTLGSYELLGNEYSIQDWDSAYNRTYQITYKDRYSFHLKSKDGKQLYFLKYR